MKKNIHGLLLLLPPFCCRWVTPWWRLFGHFIVVFLTHQGMVVGGDRVGICGGCGLVCSYGVWLAGRKKKMNLNKKNSNRIRFPEVMVLMDSTYLWEKLKIVCSEARLGHPSTFWDLQRQLETHHKQLSTMRLVSRLSLNVTSPWNYHFIGWLHLTNPSWYRRCLKLGLVMIEFIVEDLRHSPLV